MTRVIMISGGSGVEHSLEEFRQTWSRKHGALSHYTQAELDVMTQVAESKTSPSPSSYEESHAAQIAAGADVPSDIPLGKLVL